MLAYRDRRRQTEQAATCLNAKRLAPIARQLPSIVELPGIWEPAFLKAAGGGQG